MFTEKMLKYLFGKFITSGKIYECVDTDQTMSKNKDLYFEAIEDFKASFEKGKYVKMS